MSYGPPKTAEMHALHVVVLPNGKRFAARLYHGIYRRHGVARRARWIVIDGHGRGFRYSGRNLAGRLQRDWADVAKAMVQAVDE